MHTQHAPTYGAVDQIEQLVQAFEDCTLAPGQFSHHAHMTVALWYLAHLPAPEAAGRMRAGLRRLLAHHGAQGYHETITLFWLKLLGHFLDQAGPDRTILELTNSAILLLGDRALVFRHYSRERVLSDQARQEWVEPDLAPLPFSSARSHLSTSATSPGYQSSDC
jgi:hypothetical protein